MNHTTPAKLEQLRAAWEAAKEALLADPGIPCRGQVYTYQRGARRYYKWQHCAGGRRTQRTVDLASMEALVEGMAARAQVEQRLEAYYAAGEAYLLACAKGGDRPAQTPPVKKTSAHAKMKYGRRRSAPARRS